MNLNWRKMNYLLEQYKKAWTLSLLLDMEMDTEMDKEMEICTNQSNFPIQQGSGTISESLIIIYFPLLCLQMHFVIISSNICYHYIIFIS